MENNILQNLTKTEKEFVIIKTVAKNTTLFREGEKCESIAIVVSGEIKISSFSFKGEELIYNILKKNEVFGNNLIFSDDPFYKGDVIATKESVVVSLNRINLLNLLQSNKDFLLSYLNVQSNFGKKLNSTIKMLSYSSAEERFRFYLFQNGGEITYDSVTSLAGVLQIKRETLSRLLTKLEKENVIQRSPHQIILIN